MKDIKNLTEYIHPQDFDAHPEVVSAVLDSNIKVLVGAYSYYLKVEDDFDEGVYRFLECDSGGERDEFVLDCPLDKNPDFTIKNASGFNAEIYYKDRLLSRRLDFVQVFDRQCYVFEDKRFLATINWSNGIRPRQKKESSYDSGNYGPGNSWGDKGYL